MHVVFVTVRTASVRLKNKSLLKIGDISIIELLTNQLKQLKNVKAIICTTTEKTDDKLINFLNKKKIEYFRGSNHDVLNRLLMSAKKYNLEYFVVLEGDTLFCDYKIIKKTFDILNKQKYDYIIWEGLPFGTSPIGIRTKNLEELVSKKSIRNTQDGWGKMIMDSDLFQVGIFRPKNKKLDRPEFRLSIDYKEDFELAKKIYQKLPKKFEFMDVIKILEEDSSLVSINQNAQKKYELNLDKKMTKIKLKK